MDISLCGRGGAGEAGGGVFSEGVGEEGRFCDVEVLLQDSDEETLTCSPHPSDITDEDKGTAVDVAASSHAHKPPEFIQLVSRAVSHPQRKKGTSGGSSSLHLLWFQSVGSFSLLGGGVSNDISDGRGLLQLLRVLRRTVLPAHWVAVLADGPQLQLLQCSRVRTRRRDITAAHRHITPAACS